ncbi:MAG: hypothetical protein ABI480_15680 [Chitinophagaceae bacterium]
MKEPGRYFIQQYSQQYYEHGGIGYVDAERILLAEGYEPVFFPYDHDFSFKAKRARLAYLFRILFTLPKGSIVVFLFPVYARANRLLLSILGLKKIKGICFITDINGIKDGNASILKKEIRFFRHYKYFIVHNAKMQQWLDRVVPDNRSSSIEFFDFLANKLTVINKFSFDIVFAGNLEKSVFLEKLHLLQQTNPTLHFNLYGPGKTPAMLNQKNVRWCGIENPYELPLKLKGGFGLLWDGDSIDKPGGSLGDYMQYISHHKLSLYIISRLPIIVSATAASAYLVEKYKIGFTVNSLYEIETKLKSISVPQYEQMQGNMSKLATKISQGGCLREALMVVEEKM